MKIVFIIYGLQAGGAERAVTGLANYWAETHNVSIITLVNTKSFYPLNSKIKRYFCLEQPKEKTTILQSLKDVFLRLKKLKYFLKKENPDVVLSFMMKTNIYSTWVAKSLKIPCIVSERANHDFDKLPRMQERLRDFSYRYISKLVVQTEGNKNYYQKTVELSKIKVIPNGVADTLQNQRNTQTLKNCTKEKIILNVGAFRNGKAQDILIKSFAKIKAPDWRLIFLGQGPNLEKIKNLVIKLGISNRVEFAGAKQNVAFFYQQASLFVFTSEHEGFPNALLEALYFGLPCISTNCPHGPADLIKNGQNGYLVPVGNQEQLTRKIIELIEDSELRKRFSAEAIVNSRKYEMETIANQWMNLIKSVVVIES
ncbi:glycosyltransferase family 4 protein [Maribacter ulvicola]|uniref:GalNAc-alpha-(1->4)-GalNAc-alpha-(1->3)-diNAcBac-PP-undecaprenol alpha-1,4-N-acetyl-D-galactosaminyltransferase n=1 Tax=Maribacter ulvicola TaxID=228959 RepID=A0A1N6VJ53_9FLAO|nr:glycosyltransferase family 4 protein [Maribacter ulvicola]SIQ77758.1 GalNAc-alpha-(1->4)-GalNAc-alpha-(1->3)-diNAcBac-PP-undecaprenol alpha-1,4-N-acetyl-D-galactosaminyltransferase [Maribacter ulvicola]